jgi:hypothetical protein
MGQRVAQPLPRSRRLRRRGAIGDAAKCASGIRASRVDRARNGAERAQNHADDVEVSRVRRSCAVHERAIVDHEKYVLTPAEVCVTLTPESGA